MVCVKVSGLARDEYLQSNRLFGVEKHSHEGCNSPCYSNRGSDSNGAKIVFSGMPYFAAGRTHVEIERTTSPATWLNTHVARCDSPHSGLPRKEDKEDGRSIVRPTCGLVLTTRGHSAYRLSTSFQRLPRLILGHVCVQLCGARICMPQHPLHIVEALAVLGELGAACVPQLMHRVQGLAVGVALAGHRTLHYLANPREYVPIERSAALIETVPTALIQHQSPWFARTTIQLT